MFRQSLTIMTSLRCIPALHTDSSSDLTFWGSDLQIHMQTSEHCLFTSEILWNLNERWLYLTTLHNDPGFLLALSSKPFKDIPGRQSPGCFSKDADGSRDVVWRFSQCSSSSGTHHNQPQLAEKPHPQNETQDDVARTIQLLSVCVKSQSNHVHCSCVGLAQCLAEIAHGVCPSLASNAMPAMSTAKPQTVLFVCEQSWVTVLIVTACDLSSGFPSFDHGALSIRSYRTCTSV